MIRVATTWDGRPLEATEDCFDAISVRLVSAFSRIGVEHEVVLPGTAPIPGVWTLHVGYDKTIVNAARATSEMGGKTAWLQELPRTDVVDRSFHFVNRKKDGNPVEGRVRLPFPLDDCYKVCSKEPSFLLDHPAQYRDTTMITADFLANSYPKHTLYIQDGHKERHPVSPGRGTPMRWMPYGDWLAATNRIETYVVSHYESFGFSIVDMLARGTRVFAAHKCLNPWFVETMGIKVYNGIWELDALINMPPPDPEALFRRTRRRCSTWDRVANMIAENLLGDQK